MSGSTDGTCPLSRLATAWSLCSLLCLLGVPTEAAGQGADSVEAAEPSGIVLVYGAAVARPLLSGRAAAPFEAIGEVHAGPGIHLGIGYDLGRWEVSATADLSGLDIGEPTERDGIGMGRESLILKALALTVGWRPPNREWRGWRPLLGAGVVRESLDNHSLRPDQFPSSLRDTAAAAAEGAGARSAGIAGTGGRLEAGAERTLEGSLRLYLSVATDYVRFRDLSFGGVSLRWEGGPGWVPRLVATLRWSP